VPHRVKIDTTRRVRGHVIERLIGNRVNLADASVLEAPVDFAVLVFTVRTVQELEHHHILCRGDVCSSPRSRPVLRHRSGTAPRPSEIASPAAVPLSLPVPLSLGVPAAASVVIGPSSPPPCVVACWPGIGSGPTRACSGKEGGTEREGKRRRGIRARRGHDPKSRVPAKAAQPLSATFVAAGRKPGDGRHDGVRAEARFWGSSPSAAAG